MGSPDVGLLTSYAVTWAVHPVAFEFSCEDWQCADNAWKPARKQLRRYRMMCPSGFSGKLVPYTFKSEELTANGHHISKKLSVTTKGFCLYNEYFKRLPLRAAGDCVDLDLRAIQHGILPGQEILVWLDFDDQLWRLPRKEDPASNSAGYGMYLEIRRRLAAEEKEAVQPPWTIVRHEHSTMTSYPVKDQEGGMFWQACLATSPGMFFLKFGVVIISIALAFDALTPTVPLTHH